MITFSLALWLAKNYPTAQLVGRCINYFFVCYIV